MPSGGSRRGKPGVAHPQRTDLNKPLPATAVPGQPYGAAGSQLAAQAALPMAAAPAGPPPPQDAAPLPIGQMGGLTDPTTNPAQPVTHGLPIGAGPGPEAIPSAPSPVLRGLAILNTLPNLPPELKAVKDFLAVSQNNGLNG